LNVKLFSSFASSIRERVGLGSVLSILLVDWEDEWDMEGGWWGIAIGREHSHIGHANYVYLEMGLEDRG
jgi:hypothetical protein